MNPTQWRRRARHRPAGRPLRREHAQRV